MATGPQQLLVLPATNVQQVTIVELAQAFRTKHYLAHKECTALRNLGAREQTAQSALTCLIQEQLWFQTVYLVSKATNVYRQVK